MGVMGHWDNLEKFGTESAKAGCGCILLGILLPIVAAIFLFLLALLSG